MSGATPSWPSACRWCSAAPKRWLQGNLGTGNLRQMGDYGYTVDDTPRLPKDKKL